jgi:Probable lipid transfer
MEKASVVFMFVAMVAFLLVLEEVHGDGICKMSSDGLNACKPAIQNDDPVDEPSRGCCVALKKADFKCLCQYKDSYLLKAMDINSTRAFALPQMCGIMNAPYQCS